MLSGLVSARNTRYSLTKYFVSFNVYKSCGSNLGSDASARGKNLFKPCANGGVNSLHSRYYAWTGFPVGNRVEELKTKYKNWSSRTEVATNLYKSQESVDLNEFFSYFGLPDTFNSWFVVVELHTWIILSQLKCSTKRGMKLRDDVVKAFWFDVETRLEDLERHKASKKILKKQLKELSDRFPITLCIYDEGLFSNDMVLAGGLWYKFFDKECDDPRKLEVLVSYVRFQVQHLSVMELGTSIEPPSSMWLPLAPHIKAVSSPSNFH